MLRPQQPRRRRVRLRRPAPGRRGRRSGRRCARSPSLTWTLLIVGMLLKYAIRAGDWPVSVAGPIHGFAFLAYAAAALVLAVNQRWTAGAAALAVASAVVPSATVLLERAFERRGLLEGPWRTSVSDDPRDRRATGRLLRWALGRPVLAGVIVLALVAVVFAALLVVGPPGGGEG
ncbi:DUF3817 domain-containing protein [Rathayibacter tritici]|nr:DUF3817 domain-containing protein [Rathayibacter tritici]PPG06070.1 DUF3817 domain-containing protein [Rathayibacter tritici]